MTIGSDFTAALDCLAGTSAGRDAAAIWSEFETLLAPLGLRSVHYERGMPRDGTAEPCLKSGLPNGPVFGDLVCHDFMEAFRRNPEFHAADGFVRHCESSVLPMVYDADSCNDMTAPMRRANDLARDFAVTGGLIVPLRSFRDNTFGNVSYMLDRHTPARPSDLPVAELTALAHVIHGSLTHVDTRPGAKDAPKPALTRQEVACLSWVAAGLSTKRFAHRMGISDATANEYIRNACRKLHTTTRAEAAVKAVRLGLVKL